MFTYIKDYKLELLFGRGWLEMGNYPPPAFYFRVKFPSFGFHADSSFQEVSGISHEMQRDEVSEGGGIDTVYHLPKGIKYQNLVLKRGIVPKSSSLIKWCKSVMEGSFPITTQELEVSLMNARGNPIRSWTFDNAYPVKWQVDGFNSTENKVAIETIELCYSSFSRGE